MGYASRQQHFLSQKVDASRAKISECQLNLAFAKRNQVISTVFWAKYDYKGGNLKQSLMKSEQLLASGNTRSNAFNHSTLQMTYAVYMCKHWVPILAKAMDFIERVIEKRK